MAWGLTLLLAVTPADRLRQSGAPELAYAVVSSAAVLEQGVVGTRRAGTSLRARPADRFHLGSNTKAITCLVAATWVERGKLAWTTRFFDLFPELLDGARPEFRHLTLESLLTFRSGLPAYTYTFERPRAEELSGDASAQRYALAQYFLAQPPMAANEQGLTPTNAGYVLAGLMLERATHTGYQKLVTDFGRAHGLDFRFGEPNRVDGREPWGHDAEGRPLPPRDRPKLEWLLAAGNVNVDLRSAERLLQLILRGLHGREGGLPPAVFERLLFGAPHFSFGWWNERDPKSHHRVAFNEGNAGSFISRLRVDPVADRGYVILVNAATRAAEEGTEALLVDLQRPRSR